VRSVKRVGGSQPQPVGGNRRLRRPERQDYATACGLPIGLAVLAVPRWPAARDDSETHRRWSASRLSPAWTVSTRKANDSTGSPRTASAKVQTRRQFAARSRTSCSYWSGRWWRWIHAARSLSMSRNGHLYCLGDSSAGSFRAGITRIGRAVTINDVDRC
jgi:hypothetical protein